MKFLGRLSGAVLVVLLVHTSLWSQEKKEIYAPTTLVEMSPEVAAEYHRIGGKIEGSITDKKLASDLQDRFAEWLEQSGNPAEMTFEAAQRELLAKLQTVSRNFDSYKATKTLDKWPSLDKAMAQPAVAAGVPIAAAPQAPVAPVLRTTVDVDKSTGASQTESDNLPTAGWVAVWIMALISGGIGFRLYPVFFQARADNYISSPWERLKKRLGFAFGWAVGGFFAAVFLVVAVLKFLK